MCCLCHKITLSTQHHILCHTDQSRDYKSSHLYNVLHNGDYSLHHTILLYILIINESYIRQFKFKLCYDTIESTIKNLKNQRKSWVNLKKKINIGNKIKSNKVTFHDKNSLTYKAPSSHPSKLTTITCPILYMTHVVLTVCGARCVTLNAIHSRFVTTFLPFENNTDCSQI